MKKILFIILFPLVSYSQVGINTTTPDASSMLDITSNDKGLLIPRISIPNLNASAPVTTPAVSLLVYNTNSTTGVGYYYWDGLKWMSLAGTPNYWTKVGNDIYNNNSGNVGVGTTNPTNKFHIENIGTPISLLNQGFETNTIVPLTTSGNANWTTQTTQKYAGTYAAKSGAIGNNQNTNMSTTVTVPTGGATLSFYLRVSSESGYDYLKFYIDGVQQTQWSGTVNWTQQTYVLTAGTRTLTWEYSKDSGTASGEDAAYIDAISISAAAPAAMRIVDGNQGTGKVLMSDTNGNATWQQLTNSNIGDIPNIASIQGMTIPICNSISVGSTGSFTVNVKGVSTNVAWEVLNKQTKSGSATVTDNGGTTRTVALAPITAERIQVSYTFTPQLPFNPLGIIFNAYNDSGYPDTFVLNYAASAQNSITVNIARADLFASSTSNCWQGQFYFDLFITN
ncbi:hypothetical protein [Flavobacterium sp. GCM10023249]|uniref:hypothetical protein n=1 Tax=unclassified Flavobacterium TaxID=196869 RepID=UPI003607FD9F